MTSPRSFRPRAGTIVITALASLLIVSCSRQVEQPQGAVKHDEIIISYCCSAPPDEEHIAAAAKEGFNLIPAPESALPLASKHQIKVMLEDGLLNIATADSEEKLAALEKLVLRVKDNPGLGAYYLFDEPQIEQFPKLEKIVARIKKIDPDHMCFINLLPIFGARRCTPGDPIANYKHYINTFIKQLRPQLLSYDYYVFEHTPDGKPKDDLYYFHHLRAMQEVARKARLPFMNIVQASEFAPKWRLPTADEMRWQIYTTLAYGGRGISYFTYWSPPAYLGLYRDGKHIPLMAAVAQLNKEIKALSPELCQRQCLGVFHAGVGIPFPENSEVQVSQKDVVLGLFGHDKAVDSFMLVNNRYNQSQKAMITLTKKKYLEEFDRQSQNWRQITPDSQGAFQVDFKPGDGKFFRISN